MKKTAKKALVVFSGGQDSTTCLALAIEQFSQVYAITFDYGQRHRIELKQAKKITKILNIPHQTIKTDLLKNLTTSALTHNKKITAGTKKTLPSTFVPGRNLIFLSLAAIHAHELGITEIITGVCQTDFSGYPDCREKFIKSLEQSINLAIEPKEKITIHTPLMHLTKAQTIKALEKIDKLELLKHSHTCYKGERPACGKCPACRLRLKGFKEAKIQDPLKYV